MSNRAAISVCGKDQQWQPVARPSKQQSSGAQSEASRRVAALRVVLSLLVPAGLVGTAAGLPSAAALAGAARSLLCIRKVSHQAGTVEARRPCARPKVARRQRRPAQVSKPGKSTAPASPRGDSGVHQIIEQAQAALCSLFAQGLPLSSDAGSAVLQEAQDALLSIGVDPNVLEAEA